MPPRSSPASVLTSTKPHPVASRDSTRNVGSVTHTPLAQLKPIAHVFPHAPQLFRSYATVVHVTPQCTCPAMQGATHMPVMHVRSPAQTAPHMPQLLLSLRTSVQVMPHWRLGG